MESFFDLIQSIQCKYLSYNSAFFFALAHKVRVIAKVTKAQYIGLTLLSSHAQKTLSCRDSIFVSFHGFEPQPRRFFFLKSDTKWAFFVHSDTLESHVINFRGQDNF